VLAPVDVVPAAADDAALVELAVAPVALPVDAVDDFDGNSAAGAEVVVS
jgi:hypothetical protein